MGREVVNIRSSDIVIIIGGRSGALGELAISYDEGKLIGVLTGTGGISDLVDEILAACAKDTGARVVYDADPEHLVEALLSAYRSEHHRRPSCFCDDRVSGEADATADSWRDPVCGMSVGAAAAAAERIRAGKRYLFCSLAWPSSPTRTAIPSQAIPVVPSTYPTARGAVLSDRWARCCLVACAPQIPARRPRSGWNSVGPFRCTRDRSCHRLLVVRRRAEPRWCVPPAERLSAHTTNRPYRWRRFDQRRT